MASASASAAVATAVSSGSGRWGRRRSRWWQRRRQRRRRRRIEPHIPPVGAGRDRSRSSDGASGQYCLQCGGSDESAGWCSSGAVQLRCVAALVRRSSVRRSAVLCSSGAALVWGRSGVVQLWCGAALVRRSSGVAQRFVTQRCVVKFWYDAALVLCGSDVVQL